MLNSFRAWWLSCVLATAPSLSAQAADSLYAATDVRADLTHLYETLRAAHYNLYAHRSRTKYDAHYQKTLATIDAPMTRLEAIRLFTEFVAYGQIGHARVDFPVTEYIEYVTGGGKLLPFDVRVKRDESTPRFESTPRLFVAHSYTPDVRVGDELMAFNGRSAAEWVKHLGKYVSGERPYLRYAQLETFLPRLLWLDGGQTDAFELTLRRGGVDTTFTLPAGDALAVEQAKGEWEAAAYDRAAEVLPGGVAYFRPGPFFAVAEGETLETFGAYVDSVFQAFVAAEATDLLLDLRNNPGGDNSFSDLVLAWVADRPFRFTADFRVRASAETRRVLKGLAANDPEGVSAQMLTAMQAQPDGAQFSFEIPEAQPRTDAAFSGRVWALIDRTSYSNATVTAAMVQDYEMGNVLGEETADLPTSYASSAKLTLPRTNVTVTYPKAYFVRPNGDEALRGVVPDHPIARPLAPTDEDQMLRQALDYIRAQD